MQFSCDYCDTIVGLTDTECKTCGAKFANVHCPKCDYRGPVFDFTDGCPRCHSKQENFLREKLKRVNIGIVVSVLLVVSFVLMYLSLAKIV